LLRLKACSIAQLLENLYSKAADNGIPKDHSSKSVNGSRVPKFWIAFTPTASLNSS